MSLSANGSQLPRRMQTPDIVRAMLLPSHADVGSVTLWRRTPVRAEKVWPCRDVPPHDEVEGKHRSRRGIPMTTTIFDPDQDWVPADGHDDAPPQAPATASGSGPEDESGAD